MDEMLKIKNKIDKEILEKRYGFNRLVTYNSQDIGNSLGGLDELEEH